MVLGQNAIRLGRSIFFAFTQEFEGGRFAPKLGLRARTGDAPAAELSPEVEIEIQNGEEKKRRSNLATRDGEPERDSTEGRQSGRQEKFRRAQNGDGRVAREVE